MPASNLHNVFYIRRQSLTPNIDWLQFQTIFSVFLIDTCDQKSLVSILKRICTARTVEVHLFQYFKRSSMLQRYQMNIIFYAT